MGSATRVDEHAREQKLCGGGGPVASTRQKLLVGKPFISTSPHDVANEPLAAGSTLLC